MRKILFILLLVLASLSYLFEVDDLITKKITFLNDLKMLYLDKVLVISSNMEKHFKQAETIEKLRVENNELKEYKILYNTTQKQLDSLKNFLVNIQFPQTNSKIELIKVLSYVNYNDFTKVLLDREATNDESILGLISDNYAAGIAINKNGNSIGLLNGNKDCSYAVFIGANKIPGIVTSSVDNKEELFIKFIPLWSEIAKGDEVVTSGMDNIFFEGLKVGRIEEIKILPEMKIATVKPYINVLKKKYFYSYKNIETSNK